MRRGETRTREERALAKRARLYVGISGFRYEAWRGVFYPRGLSQRRELAYAARQVGSIELNGSFYSLQKPELYERWYGETPADFVFAVKGGRYLTHMKKLRDVDQGLANFFASGVLRLEDKLGPFLWQFPETLGCGDLERFERFFALLPRDTRAASKLARKHAKWMKPRASTEAGAMRPIRHAIEARASSCASEEFVDLLRKHDLASVVSDSAGRFPYLEDVTSDFMYLRLHGNEKLYESGYSPLALTRWAKRIRTWQRGTEPRDARRVGRPSRVRSARDVYVYFDNDAKVHAPFDARALAQKLGVLRVPEEL